MYGGDSDARKKRSECEAAFQRLETELRKGQAGSNEAKSATSAPPLEPTVGHVAVDPTPPPTVADDPLVKRMQELGYRAEHQKRIISVELNDGTQIDVPADEIELQYVRGKVY